MRLGQDLGYASCGNEGQPFVVTDDEQERDLGSVLESERFDESELALGPNDLVADGAQPRRGAVVDLGACSCGLAGGRAARAANLPRL
jgi:hypothetical protein